MFGVALDHVRSNRFISERQSPIPYLATTDLKPSSSTLHIFGSGPSINSISSDQWADLRKCDTFGINFFLTHSFVPAVLSIEFKVDTKIREDQACYFRLINSRSEELYERETLIIVKLAGGLSDKESVSNFLTSVRREIPDNLRRNLRLAKVTHFHPANQNGLTKTLKWINSVGLLGQEEQLKHFAQVRSSVIFALLIGMRMKYQRIVLHGFDMGAGNYFFNDKSGGAFITDPYLQSLKVLPVHRTNDVKLGFATVPVVLEYLNRLAITAGIDLLVGTPGYGSPLDNFLPSYGVSS